MKNAFDKTLVNDTTIRIKVPFAETGYRFSVEFSPEVYGVTQKSLWLSDQDLQADGVAESAEPQDS
ncbi:hypothetical protein [Rarobacter incanus]|uniref:hypothetical protein n=1 Tax=Rarobacter incanus TaxID=153494 RepID=UPI001476B371|nr:hypothetical protein [Rarobacter incanus]